MIRLDCEQGGQDWLLARLGKPTSSQFHRILTPGKLKLASGRKAYQYELHAAALVGEPQDSEDSPWMERGRDLEPEAIAYYEFEKGVTCEKVGLCLTDDGRVGASPDRLVGDDGLLEVKNHGAAKHVGILLGDEQHKHRCQVQGQLWVTGREWCDLLLYSPLLPPILTRHYPDPEWIEAWESALEIFLDEMEEGKARLREMGLYYYEETP